MFLCFCHFPNGVLGQVWYLIVLILYLCLFLYFYNIIEITFQREGSSYLACNDRNAFFSSDQQNNIMNAWSYKNVCDALAFLLDKIFLRFGTKLYRKVVGIPIGTNCAPLVADLFLFSHESDLLMSLSDD